MLTVPGNGRPSEPWVADVVSHLGGGGLIAYPTETVYGFGGRAKPDPVSRLGRLKPGDRAGFLILVADGAQVERLEWTSQARRLADAFWPGPLTLVLKDPVGAFPPGVRTSKGTVAVRHSPHQVPVALTRALGEPLTSTSANAPGSPPAVDGPGAARAARALGAGKELWVLDGGALRPGPPSTLVDLTGPVPRLLRAGAVPIERLRDLLPDLHES